MLSYILYTLTFTKEHKLHCICCGSILSLVQIFFFCFGYGNLMIMSLKQKKKKFEPRIKLNHNIYVELLAKHD